MEDALRLAQEADLDLVEVAPDARPPVCKLMDYGKYKYEADMKAREARRNQANTVLKEIRFRLKIDPHDYGTKKGHVERFLKAGDKVKVMIMFRGREQSRPEMGVRLLQRLADDVAELGFIESMPRQDGRNMIMVLGPVKKKADAKSEQRKRVADAEAQRNAGKRERVSGPAKVAPAAPAEEVSAVEEAPVETPVVETPAEAPTAPVAEPAAPKPAAKPAAAKPAAKPTPAKAAEPATDAAASGATARPAPKPTAAPRPTPTPKPVPAKPAAKPKPAARPKPGT